ncbi:TFIIH basal transcription factor complex helicase repB subunit [Diplonema papillatum]|nr:TFIIH basal transcription factor complex helicase repB subunit [Diplonema papillatum]
MDVEEADDFPADWVDGSFQDCGGGQVYAAEDDKEDDPWGDALAVPVQNKPESTPPPAVEAVEAVEVVEAVEPAVEAEEEDEKAVSQHDVDAEDTVIELTDVTADNCEASFEPGEDILDQNFDDLITLEPAPAKQRGGAKRKKSGDSPTPPPAKKPRAGAGSTATLPPEVHTEMRTVNQHPFLIHTGGKTFVAASPDCPSALADMFSYLRKIDLIEESDEKWAPLVKKLCADEKVEGCGEPPPCVTLVKLKDPVTTEAVMRFRSKQLETKVPYNVWYCPKGDTKTGPLKLRLKKEVRLHQHQRQALSSIIRHNHAGSGMIVLPCGSGKTLTGIALAAKINKTTLILCNSLTSIAQWQASIRQFCTAEDGFKMGVFSLKHAIANDMNCVLTTYSILGIDKGSATRSTIGRLQIEVRRWGLVVLDEVHVVPTATFTKAMGKFNAKCIVGLTATPLREDGKLTNLSYLISPVTFYEEADWRRLTDAGFLARVACVEVMCPLSVEFGEKFKELTTKSTTENNVARKQKRELIGTANPGKLRCCQALVLFHESQGDKVLVFCDSIFVLKYLETALGRPMISGSTKDDEKINILNAFKGAKSGATILFSRVGDTSIDLPEANVIIEVGAHFGSRCQETQRFGRVSRPKQRNPFAKEGDPDAYFYSLLSDDTEEPRFGAKRQLFLVEKGYDFITVRGEDIIAYHCEHTPGQELLLGEPPAVVEHLKDVMAFRSSTKGKTKEGA